MTPTRNDAALRHLSSRPSPQLTLSSPQYPRVLVRVPCGLPARLPAPVVAGAGKRRVRVWVSLRTPRGIPVLLPTGLANPATRLAHERARTHARPLAPSSHPQPPRCRTSVPVTPSRSPDNGHRLARPYLRVDYSH